MQWRAFVHKNTTYDLSHLWPKTCTYEQPAKKDKPARLYAVEVDFSMHCFTCRLKENDPPDPELLYSDSRETRTFDFRRYELSKLLPRIVEQLPNRKCYHTEKGNFFSTEMVDQEGQKIEYDVFFEASRTAKKGLLRLLVQSAYVRDGGRLKKKPIDFFVVLFNTLNNRPIKVPA